MARNEPAEQAGTEPAPLTPAVLDIIRQRVVERRYVLFPAEGEALLAEVERLLADLARAEQERDQARETLARLEWILHAEDDEQLAYCPACEGIKESRYGIEAGHRPDCILRAALAGREREEAT